MWVLLSLCVVSAVATAALSSASTTIPSNPSTSTDHQEPEQQLRLKPSDFLSQHQHIPIEINGDHRDTITFNVPVPSLNRTVQVKTKPNTEFYTSGFQASHIAKNGVKTIIDLDLRRFHVGSVVGEEHSKVYLHIREDGLLNGVIHMATVQLHIEPALRYDLSESMGQSRRSESNRNHLVYSFNDIKESMIDKVGEYCGAKEAKTESFYRAASVRSKRDTSNDDAVSSASSDCRVSSGGKCDCDMALVADMSFLETDYAEGSIQIAAQFMVNMAITGDAMYRQTNFSGTNGIGLAISSVTVDESSNLNQAFDDSEKLLEAFSSSGYWSNFCVAHLFTNRNFYGTLGLAYIGTLCSSSDNVGFHSSYGVPEVVQRITFVHEVGHNWGANHDSTTACTPGNDGGGNYIMYASATDGSRTNNVLFSPCSQSEMAYHINRVSCFAQSTSHCGNGIVEAGEDCDCGLSCDVSCCTTSCTVNTAKGYTCSPQDPISNPCCTAEDGSDNQCQFVTSEANLVCDDEDNCDAEAKCTGTSAACPPGAPFPDNTECACLNDDCDAHPQTGAKVCAGGVCNTSVCTLTSAAQCKSGVTEEACALSCIGSGWGNGSVCVSSFDTDRRNANQQYGVHVTEGNTCDSSRGYCNTAGVCLSVGDDLADRWATSGLAFFQNYWWAFFVVLVVFYIGHFAVRRYYRVKRHGKYAPIASTTGERTRFLGNEQRRGGFEEIGDDASESESEDEDEDNKASSIRDAYERESRMVIIKHFKDKFTAANTEEELNSATVQLKQRIGDGGIDFGAANELRMAYAHRANEIKGVTEPNANAAKFDAICGAVDATRSQATKLWHKTKTETKTSIKKIKKEIENQDYIYY